MKEQYLNYGQFATIMVGDNDRELRNLWNAASIQHSNSAEEEIRELHKLFDELAPDTSGMKTVAEKLRSILTEPRWVSVR